MGRRKVQIKRIEDDRARKVTFAKRKHGLVKKAMELSLLCDCDIALLIFTREKPDQRFYKYTSSGINSIMEKLSKSPPVVEDRHNGQYEALYVKKGKDAIDPEADLEAGLVTGMPRPSMRELNTHAQHKKNLSVEIPGGDLSGQAMMQLGAELNTPNSTALFNQLGGSLLPGSNMMSPGVISLGSLGSGLGGVPAAFSPGTLAAFGGSTGLTPSNERSTRSSAKQADLSGIKE